MKEAKQKAKELFDKYCYAIRTEETDSGYFTNVVYAKQCALIAVNEIIYYLEYVLGVDKEDFKYWKEVKKEIEKL